MKSQRVPALSWVAVGTPESPRDRAAASTVAEGWFWEMYPGSSTRWKLQLIRSDMTEVPLPDVAYETMEAAEDAANLYESALA